MAVATRTEIGWDGGYAPLPVLRETVDLGQPDVVEVEYDVSGANGLSADAARNSHLFGTTCRLAHYKTDGVLVATYTRAEYDALKAKVTEMRAKAESGPSAVCGWFRNFQDTEKRT